MDDLNGLDWSSTSSNTSKAPTGTGNYYPTLRPTPPPQLSGRSTPLSNQAPGASKPSATDSFSNLVSFGSAKQNTLSLQEQQVKLQAEKRKQEEEKKKVFERQFGGGRAWEGLGSRSAASTPPVTSRSATPGSIPLTSFGDTANGSGSGGDDDLFAAFNKDTEVDKSSFYPPPSGSSRTNTPGFGGDLSQPQAWEQGSRAGTPGFGGNKVGDLSQPQAWEQPSGSGSAGLDQFGDDDDPFGLGQMGGVKAKPAPVVFADDDDFLGDLGKPVEEVRRASPAVKAEPESEPESDDPWDKAVAELVDMGFSAEQSRRALTESGSGMDIQAAVSWILNDAHRQAKQKQTSRDPSRSNGPSNGERRDGPRRENNPAWSREEERERSQSRRKDDRSPNSDVEISKTAAAVGSNLFKTANSLWKTSQKKVQKAVADFQQDGDPNQPKWMRDAAEREQAERKAIAEGRPRREKPVTVDVTDEALMLESGSRPPPRKTKAPESRLPPSSSSREQHPTLSRPPERAAATPRWQQSASPDPRSRISKQAVEEQSAQAYISPARRKKATPQPQPTPEPDLLFSSGSSQPSKPPPRTTPQPSKSKPSTPIPIPTRPKPPPRTIPSLSPTSLSTSTTHRQTGTTHYKRGDYASAHQSYSASLLSLPATHPLTIPLLCNRALTSLKTGLPKQAVSDADAALGVIGSGEGVGEVVEMEGESKGMREYWGKAMMRKAEALEVLEKWREAGEVWKVCVEGGAGGGNAIQGRSRCEKALAPKAAPKPKPRFAAKPSASSSLATPNSAAVNRLRKANADATKADDEKFALTDSVDAKISAWRDGKRDNLRALLGSLENVMWEGSNWKKVGMGELVVNGKVKVAYMRAIGRCHPDKVCLELPLFL